MSAGSEQSSVNGIAIVGMAIRVPGAQSVQQFWKNLCDAKESISFLSDEELRGAGVPEPLFKQENYVRAAGILEDADRFDAHFFDYNPREAEHIDPQHRVFLETAWEALEDAGYSAGSFPGAIGVFAGCFANEYILMTGQSANLCGVASPTLMPAFFGRLTSEKDYLAMRVSYKMNLKGPSLTVQTACSTSLVAVQLACQSLMLGECDLALAGGVTVRVPQMAGYPWAEDLIFSRDGHTRSFDARATGTVFSSGVGIVALKRLEEAISDGDHIEAVIRGGAINNDGSGGKSSFSSPSLQGQAQVIAEALSVSGVDASTISYLEAHGTATALGDPVEISALEKVFRSQTDKKQFCAIGSLKSNIGHLIHAAGIASLIKTALMLKHKKIVPSLNFDEPNPQIDFQSSPFYLNTQLIDWDSPQGPRRAGVSSFGIGGTNSHVILEEAPARNEARESGSDPKILKLSAKGEGSLKALAARYADSLSSDSQMPVGDFCFTANTGRSNFNHRLALTGSTRDDFVNQLRRFASGDESEFVTASADSEKPLKIGFLFTGQGSQYVNMGKELYACEPVFREFMNRSEELLSPYMEERLLSVIFSESKNNQLDQTIFTQPALFALEYSLAKLWQSWGIEPDVLLGHSIGEYVAACVAGVFTLEDALPLIAKRARLMNSLTEPGSMVAVFATLNDIENELAKFRQSVSVAAINSSDLIIVSGARSSLSQLMAIFEDRKIPFKNLNVSHAFHSPLMEPVLDEFETLASRIRFSLPTKVLISNLTGTAIEGNLPYNAAYLRRHLRETVQFAECVSVLDDQRCDCLIEVGPDPVLLDLTKKQLNTRPAFLPSLNRRGSMPILETLGRLYVSGADVKWNEFYRGKDHNRISIPSYPFERKRYWLNQFIAPGHSVVSPTRLQDGDHPLLGRRVLSPLTDTQFETVFDVHDIPFLKEHSVNGRILFPATGYLEMMIAAIRKMTGSESVILQDIVFREPLFLDDESQKLHLIWRPLGDGKAEIQIFHLAGSNWTMHVSAKFEPSGERTFSFDLASKKALCSQPLSVSEFYAHKRTLGINHGSAFQGVKELFAGEGEILAHIEIPDQAGSMEAYFAHPCLVDSCIQIKEAIMDRAASDGNLYLPIIIEELFVKGRLNGSLWGHAHRPTLPQFDSAVKSTDIVASDENGNIVLQIRGMHLKAATAVGLTPQHRVDDVIYQIDWEPVPLTQEISKDSHNAARKWLILCDNTGIGLQLRERLKQAGQVSLVSPGSVDFLRLLDENQHAEIVYLWGINSGSRERQDPSIVDESLGTFFELVSAMAAKPKPCLWLVTRGAYALGGESVPISIAQAPLCGFARILPREQFDFSCRLIDLDPDQISADQLAQEILANTTADQVAYRKEIRYRPVIARSTITTSQSVSHLPSGPYALRVTEPGTLDSLRFEARPVPRLAPEEVLIEVHSTGLNFRDVLTALGRFNGALGFECSGVVKGHGEGVTRFKNGDEVMCFCTGSFSSFVAVNENLVVAKPANVRFEHAAGIPLPFLTAYYALHHCARLKQGDRILIHAAAGGVGLAAVQLAQRAGAEIFATASPSKWQFLKSIGVPHVLNSRNLDFADSILQATRREGVDVVLNSLANDFLHASVAILSEKGRFIEIGNTNVLEPDQFKALKPNASYFHFHLRDVAEKNLPFFRNMFQDIGKGFEREELSVLPTKVFAVEETVHAFRHMANAKHIGKIVISRHQKPQDFAELRLTADATYLITGGMGALGLYTANWLVQKGARHLVLLGRNAPSESARITIDQLTKQGANVHIKLGDVSSFEKLQTVLNEITLNLPPLKGIWHTAGILQDALLQQQSPERLRKVTNPKVHGAWNLHVLTADLPLDYFVLFSSMSALWGASGQTTYSAANAFLDALAHYRRFLQLPAISINWGSWGGGGMATNLDERVRSDRRSRGVLEINPEKALDAMGHVLLKGITQIGIVELDWPSFLQQLSTHRNYFFRIFAEEFSRSNVKKKTDDHLLGRLSTVPKEERVPELVRHLSETVANTLGIRMTQITPRNTLTALGVDSLMSIELSNRIQKSIGLHIPMVIFLKGLTIEQLAVELLERLSDSPAIN